MADETPSRKILIVEDEKPLARALGFKVSRHGFEIQAVYNGQEALDLLAKEKFNMILLDLVMPQKGGMDVLRELRARGDNTPVVFLSNLSDDETIRTAKELGAEDFLVKSSTPIIDVIDRIKVLLD